MVAPPTVALPARPPSDDPLPAIRLGMWVVLVGLGGFFGWAAWAPLDRAVAGTGVVVVSQQRKTVQHLSGGSVKSIEVAEGATVRSGQTLLRLDTERAAAELEGVQRQYLLARAAAERLQAQRQGHKTVVFSPALQRHAHSQKLQELLDIQARLLGTRTANFDAEDAQLIARQEQFRTELAGHLELVQRFTEQAEILQRQWTSLTGLTQEGFYPRLKLMDLEREMAEVRTDRTRAQADAHRAEKALTEARTAFERRRSEQRRELETEIVEMERQAAELQARQAVLSHQIAHGEILAPVSGTVVGLDVHTVDGVVQAGQRLMDIVPADDPYIVEARFPLAATDRLAPGQAARLHFTTMERSATPVLAAHVWTVAADRMEDARSGAPYLLVRVSIPPDEILRLARAGVPLRAGLPVEVLVNVGQRTLLSYLLKPVRDSLNKALIE